MFYLYNFIHLQRHMCFAEIFASDQPERHLANHDRVGKGRLAMLSGQITRRRTCQTLYASDQPERHLENRVRVGNRQLAMLSGQTTRRRTYLTLLQATSGSVFWKIEFAAVTGSLLPKWLCFVKKLFMNKKDPFLIIDIRRVEIPFRALRSALNEAWGNEPSGAAVFCDYIDGGGEISYSLGEMFFA